MASTYRRDETINPRSSSARRWVRTVRSDCSVSEASRTCDGKHTGSSPVRSANAMSTAFAPTDPVRCRFAQAM